MQKININRNYFHHSDSDGTTVKAPRLIVMCLPESNGGSHDSKTRHHSAISSKAILSPAPWAHIPILAHQAQVPLLWLNRQGADQEVGRLVGCKRATVIAFVDPHVPGNYEENEIFDTSIDSFIYYIGRKVATIKSERAVKLPPK